MISFKNSEYIFSFHRSYNPNYKAFFYKDVATFIHHLSKAIFAFFTEHTMNYNILAKGDSANFKSPGRKNPITI